MLLKWVRLIFSLTIQEVMAVYLFFSYIEYQVEYK